MLLEAALKARLAQHPEEAAVADKVRRGLALPALPALPALALALVLLIEQPCSGLSVAHRPLSAPAVETDARLPERTAHREARQQNGCGGGDGQVAHSVEGRLLENVCMCYASFVECSGGEGVNQTSSVECSGGKMPYTA